MSLEERLAQRPMLRVLRGRGIKLKHNTLNTLCKMCTLSSVACRNATEKNLRAYEHMQLRSFSISLVVFQRTKRHGTCRTKICETLSVPGSDEWSVIGRMSSTVEEHG